MKRILAVICAVMLPCLAHAGTTIYSDTFNSDTPGLDATPFGWTITNGGTVDIVQSGTYGITCDVNCVDLDGTDTGTKTGSGDLTVALSLNADQAYTAFFDLSGNQRILGQTDVVTVGFGGATTAISLLGSAPFSTYSISFTTGSSGLYYLSFLDNSSNNVGALLDNVSVQAVPEPQTYALLMLGLGFIAVLARRRQHR